MKLLGVLYNHKSFPVSALCLCKLNEGFSERGFSRAGASGDENVFSRRIGLHRSPIGLREVS